MWRGALERKAVEKSNCVVLKEGIKLVGAEERGRLTWGPGSCRAHEKYSSSSHW